MPRAFAAAVQRHAAHTAVIAEDGSSLSYAELDQLRIYAARALLALSVQHGDRVAIWAQNCAEWMIAGLAIHSIGAVLVPINTRMKGHEAAYVLEKSGARVLFCAGHFLGAHYPSLLTEHWPKALEHVIVLHDEQASDTGWRDFMSRSDESHTEIVMARAAAVQPGDRMDILFT
ncbi:MAG: AMP-binding protein, partial [Stenotrophobium sp.]